MNLFKTRTWSNEDCNTTLTLQGDGSTVPRLIVEMFEGKATGYADAKELRLLAKQLNKWAKKLEDHVVEDYGY